MELDKNLHIKYFLITFMFIFLLTLGCKKVENNNIDNLNLNEVNTLHIQLSAGYDDISGFFFEIIKPTTGKLIKSKYVELEDEHYPPHLSDLTYLNGDEHRFSDAYFVLEPGIYKVKVYPMKSEGEISNDCDPTQKVVEVVENYTTEVVLISNCDGTDNGGLDVIVVTNHDPSILDLEYNNSKFVLTCEDLTVSIEVEDPDPDNDSLVITWEPVEEPINARYDYSFTYNVFNFVSQSAGDYKFVVTVCDTVPNPLCTSLSFPIHVQMSVDDNGNDLGDICEDCDEGYQDNDGDGICTESCDRATAAEGYTGTCVLCGNNYDSWFESNIQSTAACYASGCSLGCSVSSSMDDNCYFWPTINGYVCVSWCGEPPILYCTEEETCDDSSGTAMCLGLTHP